MPWTRESDRPDLIEIARAAHEKRQAAEAEERARRDEERRGLEAVEDGHALERALKSPIVEWFPGVAWELVDRKLPQGQVVVRDPSSGLLFKVHESGTSHEIGWGIDLVSPNPRGHFGGRYDLLVTWAKSPADIGRWLADEEQRKNARFEGQPTTTTPEPTSPPPGPSGVSPSADGSR